MNKNLMKHWIGKENERNSWKNGGLILEKRKIEYGNKKYPGIGFVYKLKKNGKAGKTAYNKRYTLRRLFGGSGLRSARSFRFAPFSRLTPPTFLQPWSCYASPYSGCKNVVYLERYAKIF